MILSVSTLGGCKDVVVPPATTAPTVTPGYLLEGGTKYLSVSYEYPDDWLRTVLDFNSFYPKGQIKLDINGNAWVWIDTPGGPWTNTNEYVQWEVDIWKNEPDFHLLNGGKVMFGDTEGEEAIFIYHQSPGTHQVPREEMNVLCRVAAAEYKGTIYSVMLLMNTERQDYAEIKPDFDHLVATFKFLE